MPRTVYRTISAAIGHTRLLSLSMWVLIILGNIFAFISPYFYKEIADYASSLGNNPFRFSDVSIPVLSIVGCLVGSEILFRAAHLLEIPVALRSYRHTTASLYMNLLERPSSYFAERLSGELGRRVDQVGEGIKYFVSDFIWNIGWIGTSFISSLVLLYIAHPLLFAYFCAWLLAFAATSYPLLRWQYLYAQRVSESYARLSGKMIDALANISIVHAFAAESHEARHFTQEMGFVLSAEKRERIIFALNKFQQGMSIAGLGTVLLLGSLQLFTKNDLTIGDFLLVATLIPSLAGVIMSTGDAVLFAIRTYGKMANALAELRDTNDTVPEGSETLPVTDTSIDFKSVSFGYPTATDTIFDNFSLHIRAGERVGIVGHSGSGKSTLIKLLLGYYTPHQGTISIGTKPLSEVTRASLRESIAFVPQDTSLFHRTLYENIAYARPEATEDEIIAASTKAHAHDFITAQPDGYGTIVGERGVKLSGGQRQRIAIARAMLKNAPILVLDEATSALDSESEEVVRQGLHELFEGRTVIAIAHRLSTLREMDRIVVIENGKIVEDGNPKDLLAQQGSVFHTMWERQKEGFVE